MTFQCPYCRGRVHPAYEIDENGRCPECAEEEQAHIEKEELEENEKGNIA